MTFNRHNFNLVEILLALGVIMIGVVSLIGLFPTGAKLTSNATMETYGANAIEDIANYLREQALEIDKNDGAVGWQNYIISDNIIPDAQPDSMLDKSSDASYQEEIEDGNNWETVDGNNKWLFKHKSKKGVFLLVSVRGKDADEDIDLTDDADLECIDQRILILVWKTKIKRVLKEGKAATSYDYKYGAQLNFKMDWPAERPDVRKDTVGGDTVWTKLRESRFFAMNLVNPRPDEVTE